MGLSTNLVAGLTSGFDWRSMIDQLIEIDHGRVDLVEDKKSEYEAKLSAWQNVNSLLLSLKTTANALSTETAFNVYTSSATSNTTTSASDRLTVSTSSSASPSTYSVKVTNLAKSQKLSSNSFSSAGTALNLSAGDILVAGKVVNIASTDTLADVKDKINGVNTGSDPSNVTASIVKYGTNDYRLILTHDDTGEDGISLLNASSNDILGEIGFIETATASYEVKNDITGGAQSDRFTGANTAIEDLLDLNTAQSGTSLTIKDSLGIDTGSISINLATASLNDIATAINTAAVGTSISASVVSETVGSATYYRLQIDGIHASDPFSDENNVFQTLGLIKSGIGAVVGDTGANAMTTNGQVIDTGTLLVDIDGYLSHTPGDEIDFDGKDTSDANVSYVFTIDTTTTVQDFLTAIEAQYGDVTASITGEGKIQIVDNTTDTPGSSDLSVELTPSITDGNLDFGMTEAISNIRNRELVQGEDATIVVDDVTATSSSNTITDVIDGVTLNLTGENDADDTTITIQTERDLDAVKSKITNLQNAFIAVMNEINTQFTYDEENEEVGGVLFGDGTLSSVKSELISTVAQAVTGLSSDFNRLALIGITLDVTNDGNGNYSDLTLTIDDDDLTDALESNFDDVKKLFISYGSSPDVNLTYIGHTDETVGGTYDVDITQASTRTTVTGSQAIPGDGTLSGDETLTITDFATGRVATVSLTSGWDIDQVVNAVNSEFALEYTETLVGDTDNKPGGSAITASTLFSAVDGSDSDVITFAGTRRSGIHVSGTYTIADATTETIGNLMSEIEDAFEDEITAALDADGKLVITDTQTGDSRLTFSIDTSAITSLDFGTVTTDNTGGNEGRHDMPITASKTGSDELLLTHGTYGTGHIIVVSESGGTDLGLNDATQVYGKDVAGTINGLTATGSGQILTLSNDGNNADGLSMSYSGTSTTTTTFTLSLGIAKLLDRQLDFITDVTDGYVTYKKQSLEDRIDSFETQIEEMEARLNLKMERMINQFVAMELALSKIQNQSDWLSGQLTAAFSGWK